ncbi:MAG: RNA helicase domain-containing protein [Oscillospiraceae bacterium]|nr:RNA helicase domain-containing protein [Oscillospiraceae bacterium]
MSKDTRHRKYMLTIDNPGEEWSHEIIRKMLDNMNLQYWCMADEIGAEESTPHTHLFFVTAKSAIRFSTVKRLFPTAHIEPAMGTAAECKAYVEKSGKWQEDEKAETVIEGTFVEWGEIPIEQQGHRTDWDIAYDMLENGHGVLDVINTQRHLLRYRSALEQTRQDIVANEFRSTFRKLEVAYIHGATGLGKTRYVMEKYGYENVCQITGYKTGCFDKYQLEDVLILDEFAHGFKIQDMNNYLDGYPLMLPCRYANKVACYTKVYIISNLPLEMQYPAVRIENRLVWDALMRRVSKVIVFHAVGEFSEYDTREYLQSALGVSVLTELPADTFTPWEN